MNAFPTQLSLARLLDLARKLPVLQDEGYVKMASLQSKDFLRANPLIAAAVDEISSLRKLDPVYVMVNTMPANQRLPWHQDWLEPTPLQPHKGPLIERWHLPLKTNLSVLWFDSTHPDGYHMPEGCWCGPVPYWNKHMVENTGTESRIHLVVDLDCPEPMGMYE